MAKSFRLHTRQVTVVSASWVALVHLLLLCGAIVLLVESAVGADAVFPAIIDITSERDALAKIGLPLVLENILVVNGAPAKETLPITAHDYFRVFGR